MRAVSEKKMLGAYDSSSRIINFYLTVECVLRTCSPLLDGYSLSVADRYRYRLKNYLVQGVTKGKVFQDQR